MTILRRIPAVLLIAGLALSACTESQRPEPTGKGIIRAIHAMPSAAEVNFLIEERSLGNISYKNATGTQEFDDFTYNFNFDARRPGDTTLSRIATEAVTVEPDTEYVFVLTGTLAAPSVVLWEADERQWDGSETAFEVSVGHLGPNAGPLDVYFAAPGTAPTAGAARGTLEFGERLAPFDAENGDYVLTVTEAGNPAAVLFRSGSREYAERTVVLFTVQDADPSVTSNLSVRRIDQAGNSAEVADPSFPPTRRFFNAAFGSGSMDVWLDDDFVTPLVSNLEYGAVSADIPVPSGTSTYTYTAAGNPGAILLEDEDVVTATTRGTTLVIGEPGDLDTAIFTDNRRPITGFGKVRVNQVSSNLEAVDVYLVRAGTDIDEISPNLPQLATSFSSGYLHLDPGDYELSVTEPGEKTLVAGPVPLELTSGGVIETALIDTADPNVLDVTIY